MVDIHPIQIMQAFLSTAIGDENLKQDDSSLMLLLTVTFLDARFDIFSVKRFGEYSALCQKANILMRNDLRELNEDLMAFASIPSFDVSMQPIHDTFATVLLFGMKGKVCSHERRSCPVKQRRGQAMMLSECP